MDTPKDDALWPRGATNGTARVQPPADTPTRPVDGRTATAATARAVFGPGLRHRYLLTRTWGSGPVLRFIMLNPSTADALVDDPTIRRCIGFARAWGYDGIRVANLYALRSTDPRALRAVSYADRVGPDNDEVLEVLAFGAHLDGSPLVAAWGTHAEPARVQEVLAIPHMDNLKAFGVTKDGSPRHPLYQPASSTLTAWPRHVYDDLSNCVRCGRAHVGPDTPAVMYATPCPGER